MKLCYIANVRIPTEKAHGYQICKMCEKFASAGANVELYIPKRKNDIKLDAFSYYQIKKNFEIKIIEQYDFFGFWGKDKIKLYFFLNSLNFLWHLFWQRPDREVVIYSRSVEIIFVFSLLGYKTFYDAHSWPASKQRLFVFLLKKSDGVICNSQGTADIFRKNGFDNLLVAPNGVDLDNYPTISTVDVLKYREELGMPQDKKIVMYCGHLYRRKGVYNIIEVAKKMRSDNNIIFVVVGGTPRDLEEYAKEVKKNNLSNIILTGHKLRNEVPKFLLSSDILLLPNLSVDQENIYFTSPIKMFEYMATGRPIVASDLPSIREILNKHNAILVEAGQPIKLEEGIGRIVNDKNLAAHISQQAKSDATKYSWEIRARNILHFIQDKI